jgi:hypothetical protein
MRVTIGALWVTVLSALMACSASQTRQERGVVPEADGTAVGGSEQLVLSESPRGPVTVAWEVAEGAPADGATMTLHLRIERVGRWPVPMVVAVHLPEGARLVAGEAQQTLPANPEPGVEVLVFGIAIDRVPQDDLVAVVDSRTDRAGFHAEPHYRFGRPEPEAQVIVRDGAHMQGGGRDLGPTIQLDPPSQGGP